MRELIDLIYEAETQAPADVKKEIISKVKAESDPALLDRILQVLEKNNLDTKLTSVLSSDEDAKKFMRQLAQTINNTDGTLKEKQVFLDNYHKGFINIPAILKQGVAVSFDEILPDTGFAMRVFLNLIPLAPMGVGPGELALALLSPNIKFSGSDSTPGDIQINGQNIELKAKQVAGGRWTAGRKAQYDMQSIKRELEINGVTVGDRLSVKPWVTTIRPTLEPTAIKKIAKAVVNSTFKFVTNSSALEKQIVSGDIAGIKREWGLLSFENYKTITKFDAMMLMDVGNKQVISFDDAHKVADILRVDMPNIYGPEQEAMPKITFVTGGAGADAEAGADANSYPAGAAVGSATPTPLPGKRIKIAPPTNAKFAGKGKISGPKGVGREQR